MTSQIFKKYNVTVDDLTSTESVYLDDASQAVVRDTVENDANQCLGFQTTRDTYTLVKSFLFVSSNRSSEFLIVTVRSRLHRKRQPGPDGYAFYFRRKRREMLLTDRFQLTPVTSRDAAGMTRYYQMNWDHLRPWEPQRRADPREISYWQQQLRQQAADYAAGAGLMLLIRAKDQAENQAEILGTIRFSQIARGPFQACYLGFSLARAAVGQGIMQEALLVALAHMFGEEHLHRIMANYLPRNRRSGNLLDRLGFVEEGRARNYLQINGAWEDHVLTAKTNAEMAPAIA